jgi:hypothetical protein
MIERALILAALASAPAAAHDEWSNGQPVPPWIKSACCGPMDVHHLRPEQVHRNGEAYEVEGYPWLIPSAKALPSQDGGFWLFYGYLNGSPAEARCFFIPMVF